MRIGLKLFLALIFWINMQDNTNAQVNAIQFAQLDVYQNNNISVKNGERPKAIFFGNSITEGFVKTLPDFFEINHFVGRGISGQTTAQGLLRFRKDVLELNPEVVIINSGHQ
ncbi:MAG: hypothetical protein IPK46_16215 [Saprospiraceae bacterium]|nr:hypothetical protein [Saprospiraceae bacterium]